ncbi:MAG: SRPBCC family protein [Cyclobacteriaceae bacterium]
MKELEKSAKDGRINENASIRDRQSLIINAPIQKVWDILSDVKNWPTWNKEIKSAECDKVEVGAEFNWTIRLTHFSSTFQVVDAPTLLTWTGKSKLVKSIFVWNLEASDEQTILTVEESVEGFILPVFNNQSKLHDILVGWIEALKIKAED